jgi:hypothetical protein
MRRIIAVTGLLLIPGPVGAQVALLQSQTMDWASDGCVQVTTPQIVEISIFAVYFSGVTGAQFRIAPVGCPNVTFLEFIPVSGTLVIGSPEEGMAVAFGACIPQAALVGTLRYQVVPPVECCELALDGYPGIDAPIVTDCNFAEHPGALNSALISSETADCSWAPPPIEPFPPDGAADVPLSPAFQWKQAEGERHHCWIQPLSAYTWTFYFGTGPDVQYNSYMGYYNLPLLEPSTTYYWQIRINDLGAPGVGPVWSFTTTATTTPVEETTWGRVKALFR